MPAGLDATDPVPVPFADTSSVSVFNVNVAVTERAASIDTTQSPVPEQPAPNQPAKSELASGVVVSVTTVPTAKASARVAPQPNPAGLVLTKPLPVPSVAALRVLSC